jgi:hypothetical protein
MQTFTVTLSDAEYTEILIGGSVLAFDSNSQAKVRLIMTESASPPAVDAAHTMVGTWPESWDFVAENVAAGSQRIWVRADDDASGVILTGVRG